MTTLPRNREFLVVIDTQIFVPAMAAAPNESAFYASAIRKCWKFVFSDQIIAEYQRVFHKFGFRADAILHEMTKLESLNKYRHCGGDPDTISPQLAPRKDRHIVSPCLYGHANTIVSDDGGILERAERIAAETGATVLSLIQATTLLATLEDCGPWR